MDEVDIKRKAHNARLLLQNEMFSGIMESIRGKQTRVFLNSHSSIEEREAAHSIIKALSLIEGELVAILNDEKVFDHRNK